MWKYAYMFKSSDLENIGVFVPAIEKHHRDWVIPPSTIENERLDEMLNRMEKLPVNPIIYAGFFRFEWVFRKISEFHIKHEKLCNREDLEAGLEILGLMLEDSDIYSCEE